MRTTFVDLRARRLAPRHIIARLTLTVAALAAAVMPAGVQSQEASDNPFDRIEWVDAGSVVQLGSIARLTVPENCRFTGEEGSLLFDEANQNLPTPGTVGTLFCDLNPPDNPVARYWFAQYVYSPDGYIKDAAKEELDADAILETMREGTEAANVELAKRGWETMEVTGWAREPFFDVTTNNATWALAGRSSSGNVSLNHRVQLLGRRGVLGATMIASPEDYEEAVVAFDASIATTAFVSGETYAEFREGDKVAEYGLTALIVGGTGLAAAKLGLFAKFWKLIAGGVVAAVAGLKKLFGRREPSAGTVRRG